MVTSIETTTNAERAGLLREHVSDVQECLRLACLVAAEIRCPFNTNPSKHAQLAGLMSDFRAVTSGLLDCLASIATNGESPDVQETTPDK